MCKTKNPDYARERDIACLHAADVNCDEDLAKPAASCFIKMTEPSIEALIQAFLDPESRIRLAEPKSSYAEIEAIAIDNGYFDGLRLHLSNNLNAIIGGRGTGKSTLIECIRYALELQPIGEDARKAHTALVRNALENGGMVYLRVRSAAQLGRCFTISRRYGEPAEVRDEYSQLSRLSPSTLLPAIAIYGQKRDSGNCQVANHGFRFGARIIVRNPIGFDSAAGISEKACRKSLKDRQDEE
ncbi:ATP-binding protein [Candidatus Competibacter phosphatis]|uniref:ATP-binding protein n=1 Tax=Candidatus Competibacter phosphatis TaxID=221280 RepID=UPI00145C746C|nr:ATP-binding protein [Candidatus Competibacter phosphatis]